jgi:hypothetical protein
MKGFSEITPTSGMPELINILASASEFEGISLVWFLNLFLTFLATHREKQPQRSQQSCQVSYERSHCRRKNEAKLHYSSISSCP